MGKDVRGVKKGWRQRKKKMPEFLAGVTGWMTGLITDMGHSRRGPGLEGRLVSVVLGMIH